ncbi:MAG: ubiquinone/menaquinone biosynthesis methyltransferase, partial [Candidatus Acidiferrum sp.]
APPTGDAPILDVCTGTGDLALAYDKAAKGRLRIIGSDFCLPMLLPARAKACRRAASLRVQFIEADTQRLPFPSNEFQLVTVAFGLRNVTDTDKGLDEMVRVARPGGRIVILEFSRPKNWFFGSMYRFYFRQILPAIGQLLARNKDSAYEYLPASVMAFPDGEVLAEKMRSHGLSDVEWFPFTLGIATVYVGCKSLPACG